MNHLKKYVSSRIPVFSVWRRPRTPTSVPLGYVLSTVVIRPKQPGSFERQATQLPPCHFIRLEDHVQDDTLPIADNSMPFQSCGWPEQANEWYSSLPIGEQCYRYRRNGNLEVLNFTMPFQHYIENIVTRSVGTKLIFFVICTVLEKK